MCLSKAYIEKRGQRELVMAEITAIKVEAGKLQLTTLTGERKLVAANIREIDFLTHSIILENPKEGVLNEN